jgi:transcriptional regulator with XRE-family HTH domain
MIGTTPSYVTQLFRGNKIINLETIARMQLALNVEFEIKLAGEQPSIDSIKIPTSTYRSLPETRLVSQVKEADPKSMKRGTSAKGPKSKKS